MTYFPVRRGDVPARHTFGIAPIPFVPAQALKRDCATYSAVFGFELRRESLGVLRGERNRLGNHLKFRGCKITFQVCYDPADTRAYEPSRRRR